MRKPILITNSMGSFIISWKQADLLLEKALTKQVGDSLFSVHPGMDDLVLKAIQE